MKNKLFDIWKQDKASINAWLSIPNSFINLDCFGYFLVIGSPTKPANRTTSVTSSKTLDISDGEQMSPYVNWYFLLRRKDEIQSLFLYKKLSKHLTI